MYRLEDVEALESVKLRRWVAVVALLACALAAPVSAVTYQYLNEAGAAIPTQNGASSCAGTNLARTFDVQDSFTVSSIAVGLNISHNRRSDVRVELLRPGSSTPFVLVPGASSGSSNNFANYDILISSNSEGGLNDNDIDPTDEPYFFRLVSAPTIDGFYSGNSVGTWTLRMCDIRNQSSGTFNRALLVLGSSATSIPAAVCASSGTLNWGSFADMTNFSSTTVNGVLVTETETEDFGGDGGGPQNIGNFVTRTDTLGNEAGYYSLYMDAGGTGGVGDDSETVGERVTFAFSAPAAGLQFTLSDIDWANPPTYAIDFEDQVRVYGVSPTGSRVPFRYSALGDRIQTAGDVLEGDTGDSANNETRGSATVTFFGPVSSVSVEYTQGDEPASGADDQRIGIGDMQFCGFDYGDAPTSYGTAARHAMGDTRLYLGTVPGDGETAQQTGGSAASADDLDTGLLDDEDGVPTPFPALTVNAGGTYTVPGIVVTNTSGAAATLCGWIDFDINGGGQDGSFQTDEGSCITVPESGNNTDCVESPAGRFTCSLSWTVPADFVHAASNTYARFRVTPATAGMTAASFNTAIDQMGEVEDYEITAGTLPVTVAMVESELAGPDLVVRWTTATETSNVGFRIWSQGVRGGKTLLGTFESQKVDSFEPLYYEATVPGAGVSAIVVEDVSILGKSRFHGPFAVGARYGEELEPQAPAWAELRAEVGIDPQADGPQVEAFRATPPSGQRSAVLRIREEGIQRVTYEQLRAAGADLSGVPSDQIAVVDRGQGIARFVSSPGPTFGPGSYVEFYLAPALTLQSPYDAVLLLQDPRRSVAPIAMRSKPGSITTARSETRIEEERLYSFAAPGGDPWFEAQVLSWGAAARYERAFDLPDLAEGAAEVTVRGWGYGDLEGSQPDHHVRIELNGVSVGERRFDGIAPFELTFDASGLLLPEGNRLVVEVPGDVPYPFDNIAYDGLEVSYPRWTRAAEDRFSAPVAPNAPFLIDGFTPGESVSLWRIAAGGAGRMSAVAVSGSISAPGGGAVHAAGANGMRTPEISAGIPSAISRVGAEYLIVTHPALSVAAQELASFQSSRGLRATVVNVDRIYAAYNDYAPSSDALRSFIRASVASGVRYVLLAGSDTSDPYDHLGVGSYSLVPTDYVALGPIVRFSPTDETYVDADGDGVGDAAIGRLPARTPGELQSMIDKIRAWEAHAGEAGNALFVSGASDGGSGSLAQLSEIFATALPGWNRSFAAVDQLGTPTARAAVLAALDGGTRVVSFVGHSSTGQWDWNPVLRWQDVDALAASGSPGLVTAWGCWNSYFVEPNVESLAAHLLRLPEGGAAAGIGATTLTSEDSHRELGRLFFARISSGTGRVGDALREAKRQMALSGGGGDAILGMTLLGDPAMSIPPGN